MMRMNLMGNYHEPWNFTRATDNRIVAETDEDWEPYKHNRVDTYLIWGQGIWDTAVSMSMTGQPVFMDDRGILASVRGSMTKDGRLDPRKYAERITLCVNFCASIADDCLPEGGLRRLLDEIQTSRLKEEHSSLNKIWKPRREAIDEMD
jgi:hypothetical protein